MSDPLITVMPGISLIKPSKVHDLEEPGTVKSWNRMSSEYTRKEKSGLATSFGVYYEYVLTTIRRGKVIVRVEVTRAN